ncbi:lipopolysaccharide biosynthesis protein [Alteromonas antoniana]|uniref:lipopolysaccharide biosynthesis protein n=1 Tax=Alteromonas antoniana TaxID=2803813 RepID=UPI001C482942|nr:lipopolysaccharide biosynthesis protein [Alteromonas antoniana]
MPPTNSLTAKTTKTVSLFGVMKALVTMLSMLSVFILAKILTPEDFGLVAMASVIAVALQAALQIPVNQALIVMQTPVRDDFNTAFTINVIRGVLMFLVLALSAYPLSVFYGESSVTLIALAFSASLLVSGFENPALITLEKDLNVSKILYLNTFSQLIGVVMAIGLAWMTKSYWAMVVGHIANQCFRIAFSYYLRPYKPNFSLKKWRALISFSVWLTLSKIILTLAAKFDQLLIGKFLGAGVLGQFNIGNELARKPTQEFSAVLNRGLYPAFSQIKADSERTSSAFRLSLAISTSVMLPIGVGLSLLAEPIILLVLGKEWEGAIIVVQMLASITALSAINGVTKAALMAKGETKLLFQRDLFFAFIKIAAVSIGLYLEGLSGLLLGVISSQLLLIIINIQLVSAQIRISAFSQIALMIRPMLSAVVMASGLYYFYPTIDVLDHSWYYSILLIAGYAISGLILYVISHSSLWFLMSKPLGIEQKLLSLMKRVKA